jgi:SulP family sulfate permease
MRRAREWAAFVLALCVLGAMAVAFQVSFAAIIYQGELARFVDRGIALTLLGAALMAATGALTLGYRGTCCQPQDAPAIVVSLAAAGIAAGAADPTAERTFATVAALVALTAAVSGLCAWLMGRLRLGFVARFVPFPVLGGFLAATGFLLVMGALGIAVGTPVGIWNLGVLAETGTWAKWLPWAVLAVAVTWLMRRFANPFVLPLATLAAGAGFYLVLAALGIGFDEAKARGLLLGPFSAGGFLPALAGWQPLDVDWRALAGQAPSILAVVGMTSATALLSASALEVVTKVRIDPDRELRAIGLCNLASAAGGGPAGYHVLSETLLARSMGSEGRANGLVVAAGCLLALAFGASAISAVPVGALALLIGVVGLSMILDPLYDRRRSLPPADYAVVLVIPAVTAAFGFISGVAVGLLAAALLFITTFARIDLVRLETTVARMRSRLERPPDEQSRLARVGEQAAVYALAGFVFFGTAHRLVSRVEAALAGSQRPRFVLIDFERVRGIDVSAARALAGLDETCRGAGVALYLTGLDAIGARMIRDQGDGGLRLVPRLEEALEEVETALLAESPVSAAVPSLLDQLRGLHPAADVEGYFEAVSVPGGAEVIAQGGPSDSLLVLTSGLLRTEIGPVNGTPVMVARCLPGALVGEIGLYAGIPRTARVVAEAPSEFRRIDAAALDRMAREDPLLLADFHRIIAKTLARRLWRTTALLADSELPAEPGGSPHGSPG